MSTVEKNILLQKQIGGGNELLYPITKEENVIGFQDDDLISIIDILVQNKLDTEIAKRIDEDNKKKYYVGCLLFDTANVNPSTYLGFGTWNLWGSGKVPVGVDTSDTLFDTVEKTGGEKSHQLTESEMPYHSGHLVIDIGKGNFSGKYIPNSSSLFNHAGSDDGRGWDVYFANEVVPHNEAKGGSATHNNLQPFITCYIWKRTK